MCYISECFLTFRQVDASKLRLNVRETQHFQHFKNQELNSVLGRAREGSEKMNMIFPCQTKSNIFYKRKTACHRHLVTPLMIYAANKEEMLQTLAIKRRRGRLYQIYIIVFFIYLLQHDAILCLLYELKLCLRCYMQ